MLWSCIAAGLSRQYDSTLQIATGVSLQQAAASQLSLPTAPHHLVAKGGLLQQAAASHTTQLFSRPPSQIYLEAFLRGIGCVPVNWVMEDLATVEIARAQAC